MLNLTDIQIKKDQGEKISMLTCYDYAMAKILSEAEIDMILVGDSLGMVVLGYDSTQPVTMNDMIRHTQAVARGNEHAVIVGDMPYGSYDDPQQAIDNARQLMQAGASLIKVERGRQTIPVIKALLEAGIPVMGHLGLTPQTAEQFKVVGRDQETADEIRQDALMLQEIGVHSMVLECIPRQLAGEISTELRIPTIGIGAGPDCDGQVLVLYDMLGLFDDFKPKFVKHFANLKEQISAAAKNYGQEVKQKAFPAAEHCFNSK